MPPGATRNKTSKEPLCFRAERIGSGLRALRMSAPGDPKPVALRVIPLDEGVINYNFVGFGESTYMYTGIQRV